MSEGLYTEGAKQGTQAPSPAPRLIPAETEHQLRTNMEIGTANGGTSVGRLLEFLICTWNPHATRRASQNHWVRKRIKCLTPHDPEVFRPGRPQSLTFYRLS